MKQSSDATLRPIFGPIAQLAPIANGPHAHRATDRQDEDGKPGDPMTGSGADPRRSPITGAEASSPPPPRFKWKDAKASLPCSGTGLILGLILGAPACS